MEKYSVTIKNTSGIDAKMAQNIVKRASDFEAEMILKYSGKDVDLKSILGIMSLAVLDGAEIEITAKGVDAKDAIDAIREMVK
ncbi:MAG: HPr family phosphocarrier protein [Bacilli bacterium]